MRRPLSERARADIGGWLCDGARSGIAGIGDPGSGVRARTGERDGASESVTAGPLKLPSGASSANAQSHHAWTSRLVAWSW